MAKETAEQKLLKIIETSSPSSPSADPAGQEVAQKIAQAVRGQPTSGLTFFNSFLSVLGLGKNSSGGASQFSFGLKQLNTVLICVIAAIFLFLCVDFFAGVKSLQKEIDLMIDSNKNKNVGDVLKPVKSLEVFLSFIGGRNIFQPFEKKVEEKTSDEQAQPLKISSKIEKLKLVGISWLDLPETASAMIEDKESGVTYFLRQGEQIKDKDLTVKTIYADRVVLTSEGEEITIKL